MKLYQPCLKNQLLIEAKKTEYTNRISVFMKKSLAFTFLLFSSFSPTSPCQEQFSESRKSIRNVEELGAAMTRGLKIKEGQETLFRIYRNTFFPDPFNTMKGIERVFEILETYPELSKPSFREQTVSSQNRRYQKSEELSVFVNNFTKANAGMRVPLIRSGEQIPFWMKVLNITKTPDTPEQKEVLRKNAEKRLSELYAGTGLDTKNWEPADIITLYQNLQKERERQMDRGEDSSAISKVMLDLIHTAGFSNRHWLDLLKHKDPFIAIQAVRQIIDYRESLSLELGFKSFNDLKESLEVQRINKNFYDRKQLLEEMESLETQVESTGFSEEAAPYRVRALSLEESPFRGCIGGDCSSIEYFETGLDPNFIYWTKTDQFNKSSGQMTTVLGQVKTPDGEVIKVAFLDKIQSLSVEELIPFLLAVKKSLSEEGYRLTFPLDIDSLSDERSISSYIAEHILPQLQKENNILREFSPHPHKYNFPRGYSRAYDSLDLIEFNWSLPENLSVKPGAKYEPYILEYLNGETFVQNILNLRESNETANLIAFINNIMGLREFNLENLSDPDIKIYLKDLLTRVDLSLKVKKRALYELISLRRSTFGLQEFFETFDLFFTDSEKQSVIGEMSNWNNTNNASKRNFFRILNIVFNLNRFEMEVFNNLFKNKEKEDITGDDFFFAIDQNSLELVKFLLNHNSDLVNIRSEEGRTTLHFARDKSIAELLLEHNPNLIDIPNKDKTTVLHSAAIRGDENMVKFLLEQNPDLVYFKDIYGRTALHFAAENGFKNIVKQLFEQDPSLANIQSKDGETALLLAIGTGSESIVKLLLSHNLGLINTQGKAALHEAVRWGYEKLVNLLLKYDSNLVNVQNKDGDTVLHLAVERRNESMVNLLLKRNPNLIGIQNKNGETALHLAAKEGNEGMVNLLLERDPDLIDIQNKNKETALHLAARKGNEKLVKLLLERDYNLIDIQNKNKETVLHLAAREENESMVNLLLERNPNLINIQNNEGETVLHLATRKKDESMINLLLEQDPNLVNIQNNERETALHLAAREGNESMVNLLLKYHSSLANIQDGNGRTALHIAVGTGTGNENIAKLLLTLTRGPDFVNIQDKDGKTALHLAVGAGNGYIVPLLLSFNPTLNIQDKKGRTVLHEAVIEGVIAYSIVASLLEQDPNLVSIQGRDGTTAFDIASAKRDESIINLLRNFNPEFNIQNRFIRTALHEAARAGDAHTIKLLLKHHSNLVNIQDKNGYTVLHEAVEWGYENIVKLLLKRHSSLVNIQDKNGYTALHLAARRGDENMVNLLLEQDPNLVNIQNKDGETALHEAIIEGKKNMVNLLLKHDSDLNLVNIQDRNGYTVLHEAVVEGNKNMVNLLLKHDPNLANTQDKNGHTALHIAVIEGNKNMVNLLLKHDPNLANTQDKNGHTALHIAVIEGNKNMVNLLLKHDPNLANTQDKNGHTALHIAVIEGNKNMVNLLLKHDLNLANTQDGSGKTALHIAIERGFEKIVQLLRKY